MSESGSVRQSQLLPMRTVVAKVVPPVLRAAPALLILNAIRDFFFVVAQNRLQHALNFATATC